VGNLIVSFPTPSAMKKPDCPSLTPCSPETAASLRSERKRNQILQGAREVFRESGFGGASVDDIARRAGISKATMYRYFPDKAAIYKEVVQRDCQRQSVLMETEVEDHALENILMDHARNYLHFIVTPFMHDIFRAAVAESSRMPDFGRNFYMSGPDKGRRNLSPILCAAAKRGEIEIGDADFAANQFYALCSTEVFYKTLFGVVETYTEEDLEQRARTAVRTFLNAHRPDAAKPHPSDGPA
jgi:TetR/AcrR family transcriptional regulator, mexJK operon transcriptional repressor